MSWLLNCLYCTFSCNRMCCESSDLYKVNSAYFWNKVRENVEIKTPYKLLNEKRIYLSETYESILTIGFLPQSEFKVHGRLELNIANDVILLNVADLMNFLEIMNQYFSENVILPDSSRTASNVKLTPIQKRMFKLIVNGNAAKCDEETLEILFQMKSNIKMYILMMEYERKKYELLFFKLLNHFCYDKSFNETINLSSNIAYTRKFFEDLIDYHCDCIEKSFILEMASNFSEWFRICVPIFNKTLMLNESLRLKTYSTKNWPHSKEYIDVKILAKTGLYFTGIGDCVECPFCSLKLYGWNPDDNAVIDHHKYSPNCKILHCPELTQNNGDLDEANELSDLLSILQKTKTFDEVDS